MKKILNHIFIDGLSGMALGLFSTLIIGTIIGQIGTLVGNEIGTYLIAVSSVAKTVTGAGIGVGVAAKFKQGPLVTVSAAVAGMIGAFPALGMESFALGKAGEPLGAFVAALIGIAQGIGTSKLQVPNILRRPLIWLPPIISSAILGPIASAVLHMVSTPIGSGMGSAGFVGQIAAYGAMLETGMSSKVALIQIIITHFVLPAVVTLIFSEGIRKAGWIKDGDMKLEV